MEQIFGGLRVVEFAEGMAGPMAGMILADNGAQVVKVESPDGDLARQSPGFQMWNRGKKSVVLNLRQDDDRQRAGELAASADVVIAHFGADRGIPAGLDYAALKVKNPGLIYCSLSAFGIAAGHEALPAYEPLVLARCGRLNNNDDISGAHFTGRPVYLTSPFASYGAAGLAVVGIGAALRVRLMTGVGQEVTTSLLDGTSAASMRLAFERAGQKVAQKKDDASLLIRRGLSLCFMVARCKDDRFIQMCARTDHHFRNWFRAMGLEELLDQERFKGLPLGIKAFEDADEIDGIVRQAMAKRTAKEWIDTFIDEIDVGGDPFLLPEEFLEHPQMLLNDRIWKIEDPVRGTVTQIGPIANFSETPSKIPGSAPVLGQNQKDLPTIWTGSASPLGNPSGRKKAARPRPPLDGVTVVELASFVAAPLAPALLAELGARVIKIEPLSGDPFRRLGVECAHLLHGKESFAIDLKKPDAREVMKRIVRNADALIHNFRPGVPERLQLDYESLRQVNPKLVYLYAASYGSKGPQRHRPAFHSTPHALCGAGILQGGVGNVPVDDSYSDPCSGIACAVALMLGLYAKQCTGLGQYIETSMLASAGYVNSERLTLYPGASVLPMLDGQQHGLHALDRLYQTRDGWVLICVRTEGEWKALASALGQGSWLTDARLTDHGARMKNDEILAGELAVILSRDTSAHWETLAREKGLALTALANSFEEFCVDNGLATSEENPGYGAYWRLKSRIRFSESPNSAGPPPAIGQYTESILREIGFDTSEIARMVHEKMVRTM